MHFFFQKLHIAIYQKCIKKVLSIIFKKQNKKTHQLFCMGTRLRAKQTDDMQPYTQKTDLFLFWL